MRKHFTNKEILEYATLLQKVFLDTDKDIFLPVKVNFYLQKNMKTLTEAAELIEESRMGIGEQYGEFVEEESSYIIKDPENLKKAQKMINELLSLDQVIELYPINLEDLQDIQLTVAQMNAMLFMIEESKED